MAALAGIDRRYLIYLPRLGHLRVRLGPGAIMKALASLPMGCT
jgi:hypothetical protein